MGTPVQLFVYDLSQGIARETSVSLLGVQIDAVYHTSLVFGGVEYYYGAGVQTAYPGKTHHGRPMEIINLGETQLPPDVIAEYLESLKAIYTTEAYDLFLHNCNNFCNDFAMFLVGKGIPVHITSLPQTVLNTPFGQMLRPQLDRATRGITQASENPSNVPSNSLLTNGVSPQSKSQVPGMVHQPTKIRELDQLLVSAKDTCAIIFFTSATCAPCKIVYPAYDELAAEAGSKATLIKVDLHSAYEIGAKYQVRATPTFMTFLKAEKENEWSGADESKLRGNVKLLIEMAHPSHPHTQIRLRTLQRPHKQPVTYSKVPPIEKLIAKMGAVGSDGPVQALRTFVTTRQASGAIDAALPSLPDLGSFLLKSLHTLPPETLFPLVDLFRLALVDPRVSGYFAQDAQKTVAAILAKIAKLDTDCPYQLRIVTLHLASNLFTSPLFPPLLLSDPQYSAALVQLVASSLLDATHQPVRAAAASLAFNVAAFNHLRRLEEREGLLSEGNQVELMASLLEALRKEKEGKEGVRGLLLAIGLLKYRAPKGGEVDDFCEAVDAKSIISEAKSIFGDLKELAREVELVMA